MACADVAGSARWKKCVAGLGPAMPRVSVEQLGFAAFFSAVVLMKQDRMQSSPSISIRSAHILASIHSASHRLVPHAGVVGARHGLRRSRCGR